ncbi:thioesterase II family protein [Streptomyces venezuelae]|uniref:thioesterase II family protein n=1 Tax=Streptomyces venezuelae TaxID=54571 RepID=UPI00332F272B
MVVFLPPAGSSDAPYLSLGEALPPGFAAVHCEPPGRGRTADQAASRSVAETARRWAGELAALVPGRRVHLFGHSLGAMLGHELAHRLIEDGGPAPASLMVSGARDPGYRPRAAVAAAFAALSGSSAKAGGAWLAADLAMRRSHQPRTDPLPLPLALLGGISDPFASPKEMAEWRKFVTGEFVGLFTFPGGHDYLLSHRKEIAAAIASTVEFAESVQLKSEK